MTPMTPAETARYLGVPSPTVYRWIREGRLAATRVSPRRLRISRDDADALDMPVGVAPPAWRGMEHACPRSELLWGSVAAQMQAPTTRYDRVTGRNVWL